MPQAQSYDELSAHERIQVGGTKGGITTKEGGYTGHYEGEGTHAEVKHTGEAARGGGAEEAASGEGGGQRGSE
ncbi:hypothetical protein Rsub_09105 [Raphidocelis subcapitata]|uniref:Uncharacterized protein n=1 Tax=Raphidocelis subcapitata TaxID=307507 RepID=A0A2V0PEJ3_9CHLO|nr:hypothetical protein Rsub_09105 [Raphidocelis subcapitata]|eukprot:GBF96310.1 hypothetical protein Rsub_09105 [Raphidocelis subcapitata]